ncbi:TPA: tail assembly protein [Burkholderia vietnamiensis]|nr:tail assembly protein [Burkholderia vietnamiensis]
MGQALTTIRLYGVAGARFGRVHRLAVGSAHEAVRALCAVVPGFRKFLSGARDMGLTFAVFLDKTNIGRDELEFPASRSEIRIAPMIAGSKRGGLFQTILGAALMVVGALTSWSGGTTLMMMGASMMLGGVVQMLSPQTGGLSGVTDNGTSYYFNGPVNSSAQGEPVPIVYGEMLVGSKVASSGIYTEDQA